MSRPSLIGRLILASASPRRLDLLRTVGLDPEVVAPDIDETRHAEEPARAYARRLAAHKAREVWVRLGEPERPVLAADTIVLVDEDGGLVLGKPVDAEAARGMLERLAGRTHEVVTAFHLLYRGRERGRAVETRVTFRALRPAEVQGYVASGEWEGKAGGYAVQGLAGAFVKELHGSYSNVVGLPLCEVIEDLDALGALAADWTMGA
jgi:septum formation protein